MLAEQPERPLLGLPVWSHFGGGGAGGGFGGSVGGPGLAGLDRWRWNDDIVGLPDGRAAKVDPRCRLRLVVYCWAGFPTMKVPFMSG